MARFVVGDIHGRKKALLEVLNKSPIDKEKDTLICLGDVCDGGIFTKDCFDILLEFENLIYILGNHDYWARDWMRWGDTPWVWTTQGGSATIWSYGGDHNEVPEDHLVLLDYEAKPFYISEDGMLFVHGGIKPNVPIEEQSSHTMMWDRDLYQYAIDNPVPNFTHVFIGHTTTQYFSNHTYPLTFHNLTMMDTGAGGTGRLTLMNVDTKEYWQSERQDGY